MFWGKLRYNRNMKKRLFLILALGLLLILIVIITNRPTTNSLLVENPGSWNIPFSANSEIQTRITAEITELEKLLANEKDFNTRYDIFVGLSQKYIRLGDGRAAYLALSEAQKELPERALAYTNAGVLLRDLYATSSARAFLKKAVMVEPSYTQGWFSLLDFYTYNDTETSSLDKDAAYQEALTATNEDERILYNYALWLEQEKKYSEALLVWDTIAKRHPEGLPGDSQKIIEKLKTYVTP